MALSCADTRRTDRCGIQCRPVRDLLADYLRERQASVDYVTLVRLADALVRLFWADLEAHHPGISSLRLDPAATAAWKQRVLTKTIRRRQPDGSLAEIASPRESATNFLIAVRSFYLDIAQWAMDDPARWGPWAAPCPVKAGEVPHKKTADRRKSRMDQRTRERLPNLPALITATSSQRDATAERLAAAKAAAPGQLFTAAGQTLQRTATTRANVASVWAENPDSGPRRNLSREERDAFWAWAAVEVLPMTGIFRVEELTELTHHSLVQYRLPGTGELIPLLHIVPSKTDTEQLLPIGGQPRAGRRAVRDHLPDPRRRRRGAARGHLRLPRARLRPAHADPVSKARRPGKPADQRPSHPQAAGPGTGRRQAHRHCRAAPSPDPSRFPQDLHHRPSYRDVPQHVVQKILDHDSAEMTALYAVSQKLHQTGEGTADLRQLAA